MNDHGRCGWKARLVAVASTMMIALQAAGCSPSVSFRATNTPPRPVAPRAVEKVELFTTSKPTRDFMEIGIVHANPNGAGAEAATIDVMREEAAKHGCEGLIVTTDQSAVAVGGGYSASQWSTMTGTCILYR